MPRHLHTGPRAATTDTTAPIALLEVDYYYVRDMLGSRQEYTK